MGVGHRASCKRRNGHRHTRHHWREGHHNRLSTVRPSEPFVELIIVWIVRILLVRVHSFPVVVTFSRISTVVSIAHLFIFRLIFFISCSQTATFFTVMPTFFSMIPITMVSVVSRLQSGHDVSLRRRISDFLLWRRFSKFGGFDGAEMAKQSVHKWFGFYRVNRPEKVR